MTPWKQRNLDRMTSLKKARTTKLETRERIIERFPVKEDGGQLITGDLINKGGKHKRRLGKVTTLREFSHIFYLILVHPRTSQQPQSCIKQHNESL